MKKFKLIKILVLSIISIGLLSGCVDYGYEFHYSVIGGNGEIVVEDENLLDSVRLCSEGFCELNCPENSHFISRMGGKRGSHQVTFTAVPDEGFQVKEWLFNDKIVEENITTSYTATVTSNHNYKGVIAVVFEPIPNI